MHVLLLFIGIVASVIAGYLAVEIIHNIQLGEGMKGLEDKIMSEEIPKASVYCIRSVSPYSYLI
jgi:hypothetical protein